MITILNHKLIGTAFLIHIFALKKSLIANLLVELKDIKGTNLRNEASQDEDKVYLKWRQ